MGRNFETFENLLSFNVKSGFPMKKCFWNKRNGAMTCICDIEIFKNWMKLFNLAVFKISLQKTWTNLGKILQENKPFRCPVSNGKTEKIVHFEQIVDLKNSISWENQKIDEVKWSYVTDFQNKNFYRILLMVFLCPVSNSSEYTFIFLSLKRLKMWGHWRN
jgi:hypothetical protein